ncbi:serine/threonine-protein kinase [Xanthomonadaceae bacterium JHOS43]|nr:serine/threonine-protein kinase [Xanthomonadaceae bacterium JHOS43]
MKYVTDLNARFERLEPLIDRALELEGDARDKFLALCAEIHPDLIDDLRRALDPEDILPPLSGLAKDVTRERVTDRRGLRAGPWRLLEKIGQGGMGTVYLAERADGAFEKRAAIKLLRGDDSRFKEQLERERRMLARLDHPGIARLIDGGVLDDGQPWLVMELADGEDLDAWLRRMRPSRQRRLSVFLAICDAVSYAHSALVVHRDLKPGNIRVACDGTVKLLDFGIAKLISPDAARGNTRHLALTPEFAAPEQLAGETVTARTDVYALGALLYLLLTGRSPHPRFDGNWVAYIDHINQVDARPASLAAADAEGLALPAGQLRGDLDAIVARALRRDPMERYVSVDALAQDVRRHLADRPVLAHPQTWQYRSGKWLSRHWGIAASVVAILLALGAGITGIVWQAREAAAERDAALLEARRSQAVRDYLALMFRNAGSPESEQGSARAVLASAVDGIEHSFDGDPQARQHVLLTLAEIYLYIGDYPAAESLLTRFQALEQGDTPAVLRARSHIYLSTIATRRGQPQQACDEVERAFPLLDDVRTDHLRTQADAFSARGACRRLLGDTAAAVGDYEVALAMFSRKDVGDDTSLAAAHNNLATIRLHQGRNAEAEAELQAALRIYARSGRERSLDAATTLNNLAVLVLNRGDPKTAAGWLQRALEVQRAATGESAPLGAQLTNLVRVLVLLGRTDDAEAPLREALAMMQRFTGDDSLDTATTRMALVAWLDAQGNATQSLIEAERAFAQAVARLGENHVLTHRFRIQLAHARSQAGRRDAALGSLDAAITGLETGGDAARAHLATALCERAIVLRRMRPDDARNDARRCADLRNQVLGASHWETAEAIALGEALAASAQTTTQATQALQTLVATLGESSPRTRRAQSWFTSK